MRSIHTFSMPFSDFGGATRLDKREKWLCGTFPFISPRILNNVVIKAHTIPYKIDDAFSLLISLADILGANIAAWCPEGGYLRTSEERLNALSVIKKRKEYTIEVMI